MLFTVKKGQKTKIAVQPLGDNYHTEVINIIHDPQLKK